MLERNPCLPKYNRESIPMNLKDHVSVTSNQSTSSSLKASTLKNLGGDRFDKRFHHNNQRSVPRMIRWAAKRARHNHRSRKAISTIMANLTMLVIVVSLSSLLFVWSISSFGAYTGGAGYWFSSRSLANQERLSVESAFFTATGSTNNIVTLYVRNVGAVSLTIASVYINSTLYNIPPSTLGVSQVQKIQFTLVGQTWTSGNIQTVIIATVRGTTLTTV